MDLANRLEEFGLKVGQKRKNAIIKELFGVMPREIRLVGET